MTLANMRLNGVRMVTASCANCGHAADVNVDRQRIQRHFSSGQF